MTGGNTLGVTVVIPTYNRRQLLLSCLEAISQQTLPRDRFEVVVVSDASTDGTVAAAEEAGRRFGLTLRVIDAPRGGPGRARNHGIAAATGRIIAFTDDDVRVSTEWLAAGLRCFDAPEVGGVEGRIEPLLLDQSLYRPNLTNASGSLYPTANMFYRRDVLAEVGGFDRRFRKVREDSDLAFRVMDAGYRIPFAPDAVVSHCAHHESVGFPLRIAATIPECVLMRSLYPQRAEVRIRPYVSDVLKVVSAVAAVALVATGRPLVATLALACFTVLVGRAMHQQTRVERAIRQGVLLKLIGVYALVPFFHLYYFAVGWWRVVRGWKTDET